MRTLLTTLIIFISVGLFAQNPPNSSNINTAPNKHTLVKYKRVGDVLYVDYDWYTAGAGSEYPVSYAGTVYYVSNDGSDTNDGLTTSTPFQTTTKANTLALSPGDAVLFNSTDSFDGYVAVNNSGNGVNPITIGAYGVNSSKPKIYGSQAITGWSLYSGSIYQATFATAITQLFVDGVRMQVARYPSTGYAFIDTVKTTSSFVCNDLDAGVDYTGAKWIGRTNLYAMPTVSVIGSSSKTITLASAPSGGLTVDTEGFILVGKLEFLTQPGQWYSDGTTVYVWMPESDSPSGHVVRGSTLDYGVTVSSKNYVTIKDLEVLHSKTRGINLSACDYAIVDNNTVTYPEARGIYSVSGGDYITISDNTVVGANNMGIEVFTANSTVIDNSVDSTALFDNLGLTGLGSWYMGSGIYVEGNDNTIQYNDVRESGYNGIQFAYRNTVDKNYILNCNLTKDDGGGIYTAAPDAYPSAISIGSVITNNIIDGSYGTQEGFTTYTYPFGEGIYLDQWAGGVTVDGNTVTNTSSNAIYSHYGYDHIITNNTLFRNKIGIFTKYQGDGIEINNNTIYGFSRDLNDNQSEQMIWSFGTTTAPTIDTNIYINHYKSADIFMLEAATYNFAGWKTASSQDAQSTADTVALTAGYSERILYNNGKTAKTFYINNATPFDISGTPVTNFVLQPYTSKIVTGLALDCILDYSDVTAPSMTAFVIPSTDSTLTVSITTFTATGSQYLITESATTPSLSAAWTDTIPSVFTCSGYGAITLYAWTRDDAGNISTSLSDAVTITPVDVDLGYTDVYATLAFSDSRRAMPVTMTEDGQINSITMYHEAGKTGNFLFGVYSDVAGSPTTLLAYTAATAVSASEEWQTFDLTVPVSVSSGTTVWLCWVSNIGSTAIRNQSGVLGRKADLNYLYADGMPGSFGVSSLVFFDYSIYCTYTPE